MTSGSGKVLVVDDDREWLECFSDVLEAEGYSVAAAPNGLAALERLPRFKPLVLVTDVQMPTMDGRELLLRVRALDNRVPVIVVTGDRIRSDDASLAGAFRVIDKAGPVQGLLSAIADAASHRVAHLPLQKLWLAARKEVSPSSRNLVRRARCTSLRGLLGRISAAASPIHVVVVLVFAIASSLGVLHFYGFERLAGRKA